LPGTFGEPSDCGTQAIATFGRASFGFVLACSPGIPSFRSLRSILDRLPPRTISTNRFQARRKLLVE
jgi:hypothetical protein